MLRAHATEHRSWPGAQAQESKRVCIAHAARTGLQGQEWDRHALGCARAAFQAWCSQSLCTPHALRGAAGGGAGLSLPDTGMPAGGAGQHAGTEGVKEAWRREGVHDRGGWRTWV